MAKAPARTRQTLLLLQVVALFATSGCVVSSSHPLVELADSEPIPEYLLGAWDFAEVAGLSSDNQAGGVTFDENADGSLRIVVTDESGSFTRSASLTTVGDHRILSLAPIEGEDAWGFSMLSFNETSQELSFWLLRNADVVRDIRLGLVPGEVSEFDQEELAHLNASAEQLRAYFAAHPDAFSDRIAVLKKRSS